MKKRTIILSSVIITLLGFLIWSQQYPTISHIEQHLGLFPKEAFQITAEYSAGLRDASFFTEFHLPVQKYSQFLQQICGTNHSELNSNLNYRVQFYSSVSSNWRIPLTAKISVSGKCYSPPTGAILEVFVDQSDPQAYTIFIYGFT